MRHLEEEHGKWEVGNTRHCYLATHLISSQISGSIYRLAFLAPSRSFLAPSCLLPVHPGANLSHHGVQPTNQPASQPAPKTRRPSFSFSEADAASPHVCSC